MHIHPQSHLHTPLHILYILTSTCLLHTPPGHMGRPDTSLVKAAVGSESTSEPRQRPGWLATSGCYVRKPPDRHLAREPTASQSTLHQCLLLCALISDSLNFRSIKSLSEEAETRWAAPERWRGPNATESKI